MIAPNNKIKQKTFKFQKRIKATTKTHPALGIFRIRVLRNNRLLSFVRKKGTNLKQIVMFKLMTKKKLERKISLVFVTFGSHLTDAPINSWWIDILASIHDIECSVTFYR